MIVTSFVSPSTESLRATFYTHTHCVNCDKQIFMMIDNDGQPLLNDWVHTFNEAIYCDPQYGGYESEDASRRDLQAIPITGAVNLELMWQ